MKELSIEEKAVAYDEKLDVARHIYVDPSVKDEDKYYIEVIFPELAESEDERIRKELLDYCKNKAEKYPNDPKYSNISAWIAWLEKQGEQKSVEWSEEDEKQARQIERIVHDDGCTQKLQKQIADWLKSLKDRVQPKQEWSEEDENHVKSILSTIECCKAQFPNSQAVVEAYNADIDWLKNLRPQSQWKPSDLPHWKKSTLPNDNTTGFNSDYFCHNGYNINYKELFEKLPKDD